MKKETKQKIENVEELINAASNIVAIAEPAFAGIPLIVYSVNRVIGFIDNNDIVKRLKKIENQLQKNKITIEEFKEKIINLNEHKKYFSSNCLTSIILNCIPETVDIYISLFIEYVMKEDYNIQETLCEIVKKLNNDDLKLLKMISDFQKADKIEEYKNKAKENNNEEKDNASNSSHFKKIKFYDRNIIFDNITIFWNDFIKYYNICIIPLNYTLLVKGKNEDNSENIDWAFIGKSFIKLQELGLLQLDYITCLGNSNNLDIDRFHLTLFCQYLLKYIK